MRHRAAGRAAARRAAPAATCWRRSGAPRSIPVPGLEDAEVEVEAPEEEVEEDVLEDASDLEDAGDGIAEVDVEPEPGEEER